LALLDVAPKQEWLPCGQCSPSADG
jgi:hypothetical protein